MSANNHPPKITTMEEFNSVYPSEGPPSRAQSQLQVRDLKDQAEGLKTKISMLKIKTQEDNLRRRSLQSLRTPSPFTAAEGWYTSDLEYRESSSSNSNSNSGQGWSPKQAEEAEEEKEEESSPTREDEHSTDRALSPEKNAAHETAQESGDDNDDFNSVVDSHYEDAEEGEYGNNEMNEIDREELNEILNEPLDDEDDENETYVDLPPEATPHEEREDAFDYEHFYLHSALGTFSRDKMRRSSYSSNDSVETTRPYHSSTDNSRPGIHSRTNSCDSISTAATFATATEGTYSDDEQNAEDEIDLALNWPQVPRNGTLASNQKDEISNG